MRRGPSLPISSRLYCSSTPAWPTSVARLQVGELAELELALGDLAHAARARGPAARRADRSAAARRPRSPPAARGGAPRWRRRPRAGVRLDHHRPEGRARARGARGLPAARGLRRRSSAPAEVVDALGVKHDVEGGAVLDQDPPPAVEERSARCGDGTARSGCSRPGRGSTGRGTCRCQNREQRRPRSATTSACRTSSALDGARSS